MTFAEKRARRAEIIAMVQRGMTDQQIAKSLCMSPLTIRDTRQRAGVFVSKRKRRVDAKAEPHAR